jgi:hypothetical protein
MKPWQKAVVVVVMSSCKLRSFPPSQLSIDWALVSSIGLSMIGGFGGIIAFYIPQYLADGNPYSRILSLMTLPTLAM